MEFDMNRMIILIVMVLSVAALPLQLRADSLFNSESGSSLYDYVRAKEVGDIVTVYIVEAAEATQQSSMRLEKDANVSAGLGTGHFSGSASMPVQQWGIGSNKYHQGTGSSRRSGEFVATVTAKVVQRLPNGHLLIKGIRNIQIDDELQTIEVTGEVRPEDIRQDNSIVSGDIAGAQIKYKGHGAMTENTKPGIVTRLLGWLWLF
jgi:flagellar L-ring protein precursor FlgH